MIKLELTEDQLEMLLRTVYLGNWMANADCAPDDRDEGFDDIMNLVCGAALDAGLDQCVQELPDDDVPLPTAEFEEEMVPLIQEYNDHTFWDELIGRLGTRDFLEDFGEETVQDMGLEELLDKQKPYLERYEDEFGENGILNLEVVEEE